MELTPTRWQRLRQAIFACLQSAPDAFCRNRFFPMDDHG